MSNRNPNDFTKQTKFHQTYKVSRKQKTAVPNVSSNLTATGLQYTLFLDDLRLQSKREQSKLRIFFLNFIGMYLILSAIVTGLYYFGKAPPSSPQLPAGTGITHPISDQLTTETGITHPISDQLTTETGITHPISDQLTTETGITHPISDQLTTETGITHPISDQLTAETDTQGNCTTMTLRVINLNHTKTVFDHSSTAFGELARTFCGKINFVFQNFDVLNRYYSCNVNDVRPGGIIVSTVYLLSIATKSQIRNVMNLALSKNGGYLTTANIFLIDKNSLEIVMSFTPYTTESDSEGNDSFKGIPAANTEIVKTSKSANVTVANTSITSTLISTKLQPRHFSMTSSTPNHESFGKLSTANYSTAIDNFSGFQTFNTILATLFNKITEQHRVTTLQTDLGENVLTLSDLLSKDISDNVISNSNSVEMSTNIEKITGAITTTDIRDLWYYFSDNVSDSRRPGELKSDQTGVCRSNPCAFGGTCQTISNGFICHCNRSCACADLGPFCDIDPYDCTTAPEGTARTDPKDCSNYIVCTHGQAKLMSCPGAPATLIITALDQVFDHNLGVCNWRHNVACANTV